MCAGLNLKNLNQEPNKHQEPSGWKFIHCSEMIVLLAFMYCS